MSSTVNVTVHQSQFPEKVAKSLLDGVRARQIPPKFHYQSYKQARLWLAINRAYAPVWADPDCESIYDRAMAAAVEAVTGPRVAVVGLGCGDGVNEARLLRLLAERKKEISFVPCDVSLPLLLSAAKRAEAAAPGSNCHPLLCDLAEAEDLPATIDAFLRSCGSESSGGGSREPGSRTKPLSRKSIPAFLIPSPRKAGRGLGRGVPSVENSPKRDSSHPEPRIITFFGMMPNMEPQNFLPKLKSLVREGDMLLLSANLAPGPDYRAGVKRVFPGYDNEPTGAWLRAFLEDLGVGRRDGTVHFSIEECSRLLRIVADFRFARVVMLTIDGEEFAFEKGEALRLFFSYRHTAELVRGLVQPHGLRIKDQWITKSEEEGVFLCVKRTH